MQLSVSCSIMLSTQWPSCQCPQWYLWCINFDSWISTTIPLPLSYMGWSMHHSTNVMKIIIPIINSFWCDPNLCHYNWLFAVNSRPPIHKFYYMWQTNLWLTKKWVLTYTYITVTLLAVPSLSIGVLSLSYKLYVVTLLWLQQHTTL